MYTQNSAWALFILGILASFWTLIRAMRGYVPSRSAHTTQDPLQVPRYIPRLFFLSYLAFTFSYILQILEKYLSPKHPQQSEIFFLWMITLVLISLPMYSVQVRILFRYSCGPFNTIRCGYDGDTGGEEGKVREEMRRELRGVVEVGMYHRKS